MSLPGQPDPLAELIKSLKKRPSIFVSYHYARDEAYYSEFSEFFSDDYLAVRDNSVDRCIDSSQADYVIRRIREDYITGTSCTIVLCGPETYKRKYVDWEIKATLDKQHGLIGVNRPTNPQGICPARLLENWKSGYASWLQWNQLATGSLYLRSEIALASGKAASLIVNTRELQARNG